MATTPLAALTDLELHTARATRHAAAQAAFQAATDGGQTVPPAAVRRRVDRLTKAWEAALAEYERRGLLVAH